MKALLTNCLVLINFISMNAQEQKIRDKEHPIQLSKKFVIYEHDTDLKNQDIIIWKLVLEKEGEIKTKLLDEIKVEKNTVEAGIVPFIDEAFANMLNQDIIMAIPKLIDAYKEEQRIYVFLYKNRSAMLQIYNFEDGINFKKDEYSLINVYGGSVMNFGGYEMTVCKKIDEKDVFRVEIGRESGGSESKSFKIRENSVYELKKMEKVKLKKIN